MGVPPARTHRNPRQPIGVPIVGSVTVSFAVAVPILDVLTLAPVLLFTILRTDLLISGIEAYMLLFAYGLFVAGIVANRQRLHSGHNDELPREAP